MITLFDYTSFRQLFTRLEIQSPNAFKENTNSYEEKILICIHLF